MSLSKPIQSMIFEDIDETYGRCKYGDFTVVMMKSNGYINTAVCNNKGYYRWYHNSKKNQEFVEYVCKFHNKTFDEIIIKKKQTKRTNNPDNPHETRGTYVHPDLVPSIFGHHSHEFRLKVNRVMNDFLVQEHLEKERRQARIIAEQKGEILTLVQKLDKFREETFGKLSVVTEELVEVKGELVDVKGELVDVKEDVKDLTVTLGKADNKLDEVVKVVVPPARRKRLHETFGVYRTNDPKSKYSLRLYCVQKRGVKTAKNRIMRKYPNAEEIKTVSPNANTKNILHRLKEKYYLDRKNRKIKVCRNDIELLGDTTEEDVLDYIDEIVRDAEGLTEYE